MSEKSQVKYEIIRKDLIESQAELKRLLEKEGNLELLLDLGYIKVVE